MIYLFKTEDMARILHLSLHKEAFDVMVTGEKEKEFRKPTDWIKARLFEKGTEVERQYDLVKFTNGYGGDKPYFICLFQGFIKLNYDVQPIKYSNTLHLTDIKAGDFVIFCGEITEKGNIKKKSNK